ncbi:MAG: CatB-related O-acetyltransferase [Clostridia bacterium]|nr:CatB-related O-acetyltransferase [Clostridia bacterium]
MKFTKVGKYCDLSWQLSIGGSNHNYKAACMYTDTWWKKIFGVGDGLAPVDETEYTVIGNDVWMGSKANVVRGVTVGDGAVIGASALVLEDIPPYAIAVGCPARVIKYRFDAETVERLLHLRWWDWEIETIRAAADCLRGDLTEEKLERLEQFARER